MWRRTGVLTERYFRESGANGIFTAAIQQQEKKIKIGDYNINYLKIGSGPHVVFCMPGGQGTIWTDFKLQINGFNREQFTLVVWDPPGYGKSRPPNRIFDEKIYERDAEYGYELMKSLDLHRFSLLGWCDGGISGMIAAAKYPTAVSKLVVWGSRSFITPNEIDICNNKLLDVKKWSKAMREPLEAVYGAQLAVYSASWVHCMNAIFEHNDGNFCSEMLKDIKCATLILFGEKDPILDKDHASYLHTRIKGSRLHLYPNGGHNIHLKYAEDFNRRVQEFLLQ